MYALENKILSEIVSNKLGIFTTNYQSLPDNETDEVKVADLKAALEAAFEAGKNYQATRRAFYDAQDEG